MLVYQRVNWCLKNQCGNPNDKTWNQWNLLTTRTRLRQEVILHLGTENAVSTDGIIIACKLGNAVGMDVFGCFRMNQWEAPKLDKSVAISY